MGCEQSDVMPFVNAITGDDSNASQGNNNRKRVPPSQSNPPPQHFQQQFQVNPHQQQYNQNAQPVFYSPPVQAQIPVQGAPPPSSDKKIQQGPTFKKKIRPREFMEPHVNIEDDFLVHHLKYQLSLSKLTSMKNIRRRQIVQHLKLQTFWGNIGGVKDFNIGFSAYQESLVSAWIQRTFMDIWEVAHDDLFVKHLQQKIVRRKVAQQFMFQLFQLKEYVDSGLASINFMVERTQTNLYIFVQSSDEALFNIFKKLKDRYPQTSATEKIDFPDVPSTKTNMNLLDNFPAISFSDPNNMNYQTIYEDINFLLKKAIEQQETFKNDMKDILGDDVLACPKVGQVTKQGKTSFNACAVRRVFVKWAENLLEKCPDLKYTKTFMKFIKARAQIVNNFFFKSSIQATTHKTVIDCVSLLLELAKYGLKDKKRREEFVFNIYDLLRCKIKRGTPQQVVQLLDRMKATSITKSGKKFSVLRVKNRFKTNNRDLLINFRYGDVLVGEAQLCIDNSNVSKEAKLNYEFCHYIYELERSLFGPTLELMMQYQDFQRPDITVNFQAEDLVHARKDDHIKDAGPVNRKCLQGHDMISLVGNFFFPPQNPKETEEETIATSYPAICNYCDRSSTVQDQYDYCYQCGCFLCKQCSGEYSKVDTKQFWLSIQRQDLLPSITNFGQLQSLCSKNKSMVVLFWLKNSSASDLFKDCMIYQQGKLLMQPGKYIPKIAQAVYSNSGEFKDLCNRFKVTQFPTLILFNSKAEAVRTVIGFSWFQTPNLYMTQKALIEGKSLDFDIYCASCDEKMSAEPIRQDSVCLNCFGASKLINLNPQLQGYGAYCSQGHFRCLNCCYGALECPSTYRDCMGGSYIATSFITPKLSKCPKGHQMTHSKIDAPEIWQFTCFTCNKRCFIDNQHGVGECSTCKCYQCARCIGAKVLSFKDLFTTPNLVRHYVESTAEQACLCICQRHFKKAYNSRIHSIQQIRNEHQQLWTCFLCQRKGKNGQLHMACFACPVLSQVFGSKYNFEICLFCATKSQIILTEAEQKIEERPSIFTCPDDNKTMVETSIAYNKKLVITCRYCKLNYFGNTTRIYCKSCDKNCCNDCKQRLFEGRKVPCAHKCPQGHGLKFKFFGKKGLEFCDGCMVVMREEGFNCQEDDYTLCKNCVITQPPHFIGTALSKARQAIGGVGIGEEQREEQGEQEWRADYQEQQEYQEQGGSQGLGDIDFDF